MSVPPASRITTATDMTPSDKGIASCCRVPVLYKPCGTESGAEGLLTELIVHVEMNFNEAQLEIGVIPLMNSERDRVHTC